ncbi:TnpV protein [uncultured Tyzzerella sp.]|uniref:TnpV protein n=1 Tax=uncultured Tyzzerella sp. TaxID=2321398 RepID=UPI00294398E6|nr:TnpV protein [uncultured Tyzzerella sp.]
MRKEKFNENNGLSYELGEDSMYYPTIEIMELKVGKYGKLAMEHMRELNQIDYNSLGIRGKLPEIFNDIDNKVYEMIDRLMEKKLKEEPIQDEWNVLEIERHKKMLHREVEEIVLKEIVYKDHFKDIDMEEIIFGE